MKSTIKKAKQKQNDHFVMDFQIQCDLEVIPFQFSLIEILV